MTLAKLVRSVDVIIDVIIAMIVSVVNPIVAYRIYLDWTRLDDKASVFIGYLIVISYVVGGRICSVGDIEAYIVDTAVIDVLEYLYGILVDNDFMLNTRLGIKAKSETVLADNGRDVAARMSEPVVIIHIAVGCYRNGSLVYRERAVITGDRVVSGYVIVGIFAALVADIEFNVVFSIGYNVLKYGNRACVDDYLMDNSRFLINTKSEAAVVNKSYDAIVEMLLTVVIIAVGVGYYGNGSLSYRNSTVFVGYLVIIRNVVVGRGRDTVGNVEEKLVYFVIRNVFVLVYVRNNKALSVCETETSVVKTLVHGIKSVKLSVIIFVIGVCVDGQRTAGYLEYSVFNGYLIVFRHIGLTELDPYILSADTRVCDRTEVRYRYPRGGSLYHVS